MDNTYRWAGIFALAVVATAGHCWADPIVIIEPGRIAATIYVPAEVMQAEDRPTSGADETSHHVVHNSPIKPLTLVRESVEDLARVLEKMSGVAVPIVTRPPGEKEAAFPIFIGGFADTVFGPLDRVTEFGQRFRLVVSSQGVGLQGESNEALSHAVYELLDDLGCRWYLPGEMGEVIPALPRVTLPAMDRQKAPRTISRNVWYADADFRRRNRLGGIAFDAGHALEGYISLDQLEANPTWQAMRDGERRLTRVDVGHHLCWGNPAVSEAVAESMIARLDKKYTPCLSVSPGDYSSGFCECERCAALDAGDWDPTMNTLSMTDRYVNFVNRVAERVTAKYPQVKLGFLAYVQYTRPPVREKLHPALIPQLAPITYCRAHTVCDETCPTRPLLKAILEGWGRAAQNIAMYEYFFQLAEVGAPFPMIRRNVEELPLHYANGITLWTPETLPNFETSLPGISLAIRMAMCPDADPRAILDEFYDVFYGAAAERMRRYWEYIDSRWTEVPEHAGGGFGYMRMFPPDTLARARLLMNEAMGACQTAMEYRRVQLADESLRQFERFMKMRRDYFAGRFDRLEAECDGWTRHHEDLAGRYAGCFAFTKTYWAPETVAVRYARDSFLRSYRDASRVSREHRVVTPPVNVWRYAADPNKVGSRQGWETRDFDDAAWKQTDVATDTWAALGLMEYFGSVWYRATVHLPDLPAGKRVFLWVGATDGLCKVFVNGEHVPFVNASGETAAAADGFCKAFSFDISAAARPGIENSLTIVGTRHTINELGTGGLLGPVFVYCDP